MRLHPVAAVAAILLFAVNAHAAVVGSLDFQGDSITAPVAFTDKFNSTLEVTEGLKFLIGPQQHGAVTLELLQGTPNISLAAAAIDSAFKASAVLPFTITSGDLATGAHKFAISALATGNAVIGYRLTLTPLPGALFMLAPAVAALGLWNFARGRLQDPQAV